MSLKLLAVTAYKRYVGEEYNLRQCECRKDWETMGADEPGKCRCRGICPSKVTPAFLTEAAGQALCSLEEETGFNCWAECDTPEVDEVKWYASPCSPEKLPCDKRILAGRRQRTKEAAKPKNEVPAPPPKVEPKVEPKKAANDDTLVDLRGLNCELLNGKEVR